MTTDSRRVAADESFDRLARVVRDALGVPIALVSIVEPDRQAFPGAVGLSGEVAERRTTPLTHSFCQYVVADDAPLVIPDAREDERLRTNLAIRDLGVIAYAGYPLKDGSGTTIGSVCAIDSQPRRWSERDVRMLGDIAAACSTELQLRESRRVLRERAAVAAEISIRAGLHLALSDGLAGAGTASEIAAALHDVATRHMGCHQAGIWLLDEHGRSLRYVDHASRAWPQAQRAAVLRVDDSNPLGVVLQRREMRIYPDRAAQDAEFPQLRTEPMSEAERDGQARVIAPLIVGGHPLGVLALVWPHSRSFAESEITSITALTGYAAQALSRAQLLAERSRTAITLQTALLSEVSDQEGLQVASRYVPAAHDERVGGDWYDMIQRSSGDIIVVIGDVAGHDIIAAGIMGQIRSVLGTIAFDRDDSPAALVQRLDETLRGLRVGAMTTLVVGRISAAAGGSSRDFCWTSAGHPPPLVRHPDGRVEVLDQHKPDPPIAVGLTGERADHSTTLQVGATLCLYTDGLVDIRKQPYEERLRQLSDVVAREHPSVDGLLDAIQRDLIGEAPDDDCAVLALRVI